MSSFEPGRLLARQLRRSWGVGSGQDLAGVLQGLIRLAQDPGVDPVLRQPLACMGELLQGVDQAYTQNERDLDLSQRSLALSSAELNAYNQRLQAESDQVRQASAQLRQTIERLTQGLGLNEDAAEPALQPQAHDLGSVTRQIEKLVAAHQASRAQLQLSEQRLALAVQGANLGLWDWQLDSGHVYFSEEWANMLGYQVQDLQPEAATMMDLLHPEDQARFVAAVQSYFDAQRRDTFRVEVRMRCRRGEYKWIEYCGHVADYAADGAPLRATGVSLDISARKSYETAMQAARASAEAASRAKGDFLANMSHEIRTPMNGILGMTELCLATDLNDTQREYLGMVHSSAKGLLTVINDILDFSKIEANKLMLERNPFSLHQVLRHAMAPMRLTAQTQGLSLVVEVAPGVPDGVMGDAGRLRQVLLNLVGNALKFTEQGTVTLRVSLADPGASGAARTVRFRVRDTGIGIAPDRLATVFEAFSQADTSITRRFGGTGLGLTISSRLVALMGGRLQVHSELGRGSEFWFDLKLDAAPTDLTRLEAPSPAAGAGPAPRALRILLAEDHPINQVVARKALEVMGHEVVLVGDGLAVVDRYAKERFDLVLMDIQMPGLDGFAATRRIRDIEARRGLHTPILAMTAHAMEGYRERCIEGGMDGYVTKPVDRRQLVGEIARVMR